MCAIFSFFKKTLTEMNNGNIVIAGYGSFSYLSLKNFVNWNKTAL